MSTMLSSDAPSPTPLIIADIYAHYGRRLYSDFLRSQKDVPTGGPIFFPPQDDGVQAQLLSDAESPAAAVGILGAGMGGLYTAFMLLERGIDFKIIEASERVGGRVFTHTFPDSSGYPYNYFDVGAMRFPKTEWMTRLFKLIHDPRLNSDGFALASKLREYVFQNDQNLMSYNGVTVNVSSASDPNVFRPLEVLKDVSLQDAESYAKAGPGAILADALKPFAMALLEDPQNIPYTKGWNKLMEFDNYSVRAYLSIAYKPSDALKIPDRPLSNDVVNWIETFTNSTGSFDRAFSEAVLESLAFAEFTNSSGGDKPKNVWHCIDGGSFQIADTVYRYIKKYKPQAFEFRKRVTAIKAIVGVDGKTTKIKVFTDKGGTYLFEHVISTIPLPVLRTLDLREAKLSYMQSNALRQLNYGPSVKIGMQFQNAWWSTKPLAIHGGQSTCDSPLRTIVYPSYGEGKSTALIASYTWTEDAERLAAMVENDRETLIELALRELARVHGVELSYLRNLLVGTFAWSWSLDPLTMGAFAFFGPGKFRNPYTSLTQPAADGRLYFAGEALSVRHAWVEGALDSAWRAVNCMFMRPAYLDEERLRTFWNNWGLNAEWFELEPRRPRQGKAAPVEGGVKHPDEADEEAALPDGLYKVPTTDSGELDVQALLRCNLLFQGMEL